MGNIQVRVQDAILKPVEEVFEAIVNPEKLSVYFISKASHPITENQNIKWFFEDVEMEFTIKTKEVINNKLISFNWDAGGIEVLVTIILESLSPDKTRIEISEESFPFTKEGVKQALSQTHGWTDFICSLKAFLYCGISLRGGRNAQLR